MLSDEKVKETRTISSGFCYCNVKFRFWDRNRLAVMEDVNMKGLWLTSLASSIYQS
jgi:hypothetical protein